MSDIKHQLRVKADAYEDFKEDTYLNALLKDAADTIEVLEEQVKVLTTQTGIEACRSANLASVRFGIVELTRRINALQAFGDQMQAEIQEMKD